MTKKEGKRCWRCNLGVETLYLPFAVRRGWADKIDLVGTDLCFKRLVEDQHIMPKTSYWCDLPFGHKGKHGRPGVKYLHPSQM